MTKWLDELIKEGWNGPGIGTNEEMNEWMKKWLDELIKEGRKGPGIGGLRTKKQTNEWQND